MVHVDDVADGILAALDRGEAGERYILGGENVTVADMARRCLKAAGIRKPVVVVPEWVLRTAVRVAARLRLPAPMPADLVGGHRRGEPQPRRHAHGRPEHPLRHHHDRLGDPGCLQAPASHFRDRHVLPAEDVALPRFAPVERGENPIATSSTCTTDAPPFSASAASS